VAESSAQMQQCTVLFGYIDNALLQQSVVTLALVLLAVHQSNHPCP
jgi:hypothetical protein